MALNPASQPERRQSLLVSPTPAVASHLRLSTV
jgi:hypothetical protein